MRNRLLLGQRRSRCRPDRGPGPQHAAVGLQLGESARADSTRAVHSVRGAVDRGLRANDSALARVHLSLVRSRRGARCGPRGVDSRRAARRRERHAAARHRAQGNHRARARPVGRDALPRCAPGLGALPEREPARWCLLRHGGQGQPAPRDAGLRTGRSSPRRGRSGQDRAPTSRTARAPGSGPRRAAASSRPVAW